MRLSRRRISSCSRAVSVCSRFRTLGVSSVPYALLVVHVRADDLRLAPRRLDLLLQRRHGRLVLRLLPLHLPFTPSLGYTDAVIACMELESS